MPVNIAAAGGKQRVLCRAAAAAVARIFRDKSEDADASGSHTGCTQLQHCAALAKQRFTIERSIESLQPGPLLLQLFLPGPCKEAERALYRLVGRIRADI